MCYDWIIWIVRIIFVILHHILLIDTLYIRNNIIYIKEYTHITKLR